MGSNGEIVLRLTASGRSRSSSGCSTVDAGYFDPRDPRADGLKGDRARAEKLTPEERSAIARKAAAARWEPSAVRFRRSRTEDEEETD